VIETRRIGDKSMTLHRITDENGVVEEHETRKNIKDEEVEDFKRNWSTKTYHKNEQLPAPKEENVTNSESKEDNKAENQ